MKKFTRRAARVRAAVIRAAVIRAVSFVALATMFQASSAIAQTEVDLSTDVRMHFVSRGPADGPALVLLHGYSDSGFSFSRILPLLPADRRIIVPDLRGHGRSSQPPGGYGMDDLATDVLALLDVLDVESAVVLGHSMGSFVAQRMAALAPERVEGLVLVGSAPSIRGLAGLDEFRGAVDGLADPVPETFVRAFQESTVAGPLPAEFMDAVVAESMRLPAGIWQQLLQGMLETPAVAAGEITAPTIVQWGAEDGVFGGRAQQDRLLELIPGARLTVYEGVGHAPHWEDPERFAADLAAFLDGGDPRDS